MKLTLRKAAKVAQMMREAADNIRVQARIDLNEFSDPMQNLEAARAQAVKDNDEKINLLSAVYHLREQIGVVNATAGISSLMSQGAFIDAQIRILEDQSSSSNLRLSSEYIQGRLAKAKTATDTRYGYHDDLTSGVYTGEDASVMKQTLQHLRKEKVNIQDSILELNVNTSIEVDDEFKEVLSKFV